MKLEAYTTSWKSQIAPCIQTRISRRITQDDNCYSIIREEIIDLLDKHSEAQDEAWEIYNHCEELNKMAAEG